ncbi:MAG: hypothetical protein V7647_1332 [Acidobacteriota bacterium]|jgi:hypothetical protein
MTARINEIAAVAALSVVLTLGLALPALRAPTERIFGHELVGRHADPFIVMEEFGRPAAAGIHFQPATDVPGRLLARAIGPVPAYNWLVLLTFPLSAVTAYALARDLALARGAAMFAALAFAFSPFHLAHAAYHPHIAQTQWIPLYFFALWRCLDAARPASLALLAAATAGVVLSNFYGGLVVATLTPIAIGAVWMFRTRRLPHARAALGATIAVLLVMGGIGVVWAWYAVRHAAGGATSIAFPREDLFRYSAKWWSYLVPPAASPVLGGIAASVWAKAGVHEGVLEQQVSVGSGVAALALIAVVAWTARDRRAALWAVPMVTVMAIAALLCSLSPERTIGAFSVSRPSGFLYRVVPMFRSYARFGVVVQLMAVLLAGLGAQVLWYGRRARARIACIALVVLAVGEYGVWPPALSRDVLPTPAHRWVTRQPAPGRAVDCAALTTESASIEWLSGGRIALRPAGFDDCTEPNLAQKLSAGGYTHVILRRGTQEGEWLASQGAPEGLRLAGRFSDADVFSVTVAPPVVYTSQMSGFYPREYDATSTWRWMGVAASWNVVNSSGAPVRASAAVELGTVQGTRRVVLVLDGQTVQTLAVDEERRMTRIGPLVLLPGAHEVAFHALDAPAVARDLLGNGDPRPLSVRFGAWRWDPDGARP